MISRPYHALTVSLRLCFASCKTSQNVTDFSQLLSAIMKSTLYAAFLYGYLFMKQETVGKKLRCFIDMDALVPNE